MKSNFVMKKGLKQLSYGRNRDRNIHLAGIEAETNIRLAGI